MAIPAFHGFASVTLADGPTSPTLEARSPLYFRELRLLTAKLDAIAPFYEKALGLPVTRRGDTVTIAAGRSRLVFSSATDGTSPYYHVAFNIPENKLGPAIEWTKDRFELLVDPRTESEIVHFRNWNAHSVFFIDPAHNLLEFIARHTLENANDGAFSPADILNTSEIGVVVEDVPSTAGLLERELGVAAYAAPPNPAFGAVGDENGLFIVVPPGRPGRWPEWRGFGGPFPTGIVIDAAGSGTLSLPGYPYRIATS